MTSTEISPIQLTPGAVKEVKHLLKELGAPSGHGLRLGVKGGGCSGFSYVLEFGEPKDSDNVYEVEDFVVIVDKSQEMYLAGTELDYEEGLNNRGFIFKNPNAETTCGCGTSFSA